MCYSESSHPTGRGNPYSCKGESHPPAGNPPTVPALPASPTQESPHLEGICRPQDLSHCILVKIHPRPPSLSLQSSLAISCFFPESRHHPVHVRTITSLLSRGPVQKQLSLCLVLRSKMSSRRLCVQKIAGSQWLVLAIPSPLRHYM